MRWVVASVSGTVICQVSFAGTGTLCVKKEGPPSVPPSSSIGLGGAPGSPQVPVDFSGYSSATFQIVVSNLAPGDEVLPFSNAEVGVGPGQTGRRNPFANPSMLAASPSGQLTVFVEGGGTQRRIAGSNATTMLTNLNFGIRSGQVPRILAGDNYDDGVNVTFIRFDMQIGSVPGPRDIIFTIPQESILGSRISYYRNVMGDEGFIPIAVGDQIPFVLHVKICAADFNGDDSLDFFDYLDFIDAFASNSGQADFNGDDVVDFFDYLDFVDAFSTGC